MKTGFIKFIFVCILLVNSLPVYAGGNNDDAAELLKQGNELFKQANDLALTDTESARGLYGKAIMRFEKIVKDYKIENGKLFYNIGNTYFRMEDIGNAILNYRRAQQYIPSDINLIRNLNYAQVRRIDSFEEKESKQVLKTLFFWHYDFPFKVKGIFFGIAFALVWILAIVRLFIKHPALNWAIGLFSVFSIFLFSSLAIDYAKYKLVKPGVIVAREVIARKGDSETYEPTFKQPLHAGTEFVLKADRGSWVQVELPDGTLCWLPKNSIGMVRK